MAVDLAFRCSDVSTQSSDMIVRINLGHDHIHIPIQQFRSFVPQQLPDQIVGMSDIAQLSLVTSDHHHSCLRIFVVLTAGLIDLGGVFDVLADDVRLLQVLDIVALLIGDLE